MSLLRSGAQKFLLGARKRKKATSSNYIISMDATDLSRSTENCVGKLRYCIHTHKLTLCKSGCCNLCHVCVCCRSNFVGTSFTIYDNGLNPGRGVATPSGSNLREELAVVSYVSSYTLSLYIQRLSRYKAQDRACVNAVPIYACKLNMNCAHLKCRAQVYNWWPLSFCVQETNVLGFKGPRKMNVVVPALTKSHQRIAVKPRTVS